MPRPNPRFDPAPGSGDYLLSRTHADWSWWSPTPDGGRVYLPNEQIIEIFKPADPTVEWVQRRDWVTGKPPSRDRKV